MNKDAIVLIASNDPENIKTLYNLFAEDYDVQIATDGKECLTSSVSAPVPDLILLDIDLPDQSGYDVLKALKRKHRTYSIPVILVAQNPTEKEEEFGLELGAVDYISKPFRLAIVKARIKTQISLKKLYEGMISSAKHDPLTGLCNRALFNENAEKYIARYHRDNVPFSVMILDLDNFKQVNDTHGHAQGDSALKLISDTLTSQCRAEDLICRWGGEEFVVLLNNCNLDKAIEKAEQIRITIAALNTLGFGLTVSIGLTEFGAFAYDIEEVINITDKALYRAKNTGRNKVCATSSCAKQIISPP